MAKHFQQPPTELLADRPIFTMGEIKGLPHGVDTEFDLISDPYFLRMKEADCLDPFGVLLTLRATKAYNDAQPDKLTRKRYIDIDMMIGNLHSNWDVPFQKFADNFKFKLPNDADTELMRTWLVQHGYKCIEH